MWQQIATTIEIARRENTQGFEENLDAAQRGGRVAGAARKEIESEIGGPIVTGENFLPKHKQKPLLDMGDEKTT